MEKKKVVRCIVNTDGKLGVQAISLVEFPAIESNWVALKNVKLSASNDDKKMIYGPALIPDKYIMRIDENTKEEYYIVFDSATIQQCAHMYLTKHLQNNTTYEHTYSVTGVTTVESWIKEGDSDKSVSLGITDLPNGTWMVGMKVEDDTIWSDIKAGKVKGFSIEGFFDEVGVGLSQYNNEDRLWSELESLLSSMLHSVKS